MAVITNYTSYDQAYYYADLKRLPRLSEEERRRLTASLPLANDPQLTTQIKHQLIESYLPLAKYFAIDLSPKSRYQRDLPDLIGVASIFGDDAGRWLADQADGGARDVRLRVAVRHAERASAERLVREVTALYTCGPAGGGGVRTALRPTLGTVSCLLPREQVRAAFEMVE